MNWCLVKIFLVFCAVVLCAGEDYSSEHHTPDQPQSEIKDEPFTEHEESNSGHDDEYYSEDDDIRKHHYHNHGHYSHHGHHHGSHYVVTTTPKPKPPTTESGPVPLPHPNPTTCPRYEEYHDCGSPCQVECANLGQVCNIQNVRCSDGCYCIPGYARLSANGPCVPQFNCPRPYCSANEVWLDCFQAPACDRECTSLGKPCDTVGSSCNAGCFCRPGYARHPETGDCVSTKRCPPRPTQPRPTKPRPTPPRPTLPPPTSPPKCSYNENFKSCGWRCSEDCDSDKCKYDKRPCEKGCFCYPGYARVNNNCIPRTFCPKTCPKYERYLDCGNSCMESCVKNSSKCKACERSGCFCIEGYSRIDGVCQADNQCPNNQCGAHEVYSECGSACQDDCDETVVCTAQCVEGCFCEKGYARVEGKCVPRSYCPKNQCKSHEVYLECGSACQDDCDQNKPCTDQCVEGCFCEDGYARINGVCVPRSKCKNCPLNEQYLECGNACIESCYEETSRCIPCASSGCFCVDGYSRIDGVCRPDSQCPNRQCPAHEQFLECGSACQDDCEPSDSCTEQCIRGCFCEADYARVDGKCIPRLECPVECPDNEHYEPCGNMCIEHCDRDLLDCSNACYPGCYCDEGYARIGEECLPRKKCNKCPLNEEYLTCGNGCQDLCDPSATQCSSECVEGCFCQPGYSRINGLCVPRSKCFKCESGEQYYECSNDCLERCDRNVILCPADCEEGCFCAPGFSRIKKQCLPTELCPKCGENEEYQDCGNHCLEKCGNKQCPLDLACHAGCYCKKGYKRDGKKCVPENKCPPQCTNLNEVYSLCGNNCTDLCPDPNRVCTLECYNGCFCAEGYSRLDYNSPCIPTDQCPGQCSGENEQFYECGNDCFDSCPDPNLVCTLECTRGCFCQPNYVRLTPGGKCVPEWKCPNPCARPFEELNTCGNNCTELCPRPGRACEKNCWKGCFCKKGYYRASYNGLCIPESKCPPPPDCTGPNEEVRDCGSRCDDDCPGVIYECPLNCQVGCYCKPGFKRVDPDGECVFEGQCPPVCRKPNEAFTECGSPCREECPYPDALCPEVCYLGCYCQDGYSRINGECVPTSQCPSICTDPYETYSDCGNRCSEQCNSEVCPAVCEVGCFCKPGYSRQDGKCIPKRKCPPKCNDPNEEYTNCGSECQEQCGPSDTACPYECKVGCFCKAGYSRNNSVCIETSQCPDVVCGRNEVYSDCGRDCQTTCDNMGVKCPIVHITCPSECYCLPGYARIYEGGSCVEQDICPNSPCGDNEVWLECGEPKQPIPCPQNCQDLGKPCQEELPTCDSPVPGGCYCKPGFARAPLSERCVPISTCRSYRH